MTMQAASRRPARVAAGPPDRREWDVICIGSGMGSLAAAATLAKSGRSVLVLEAHGQLGGLTHTFKRKGARWGTGLHYTGWPTAYPCDFPDLWRTLTGGRAPWTRLPDDADRYIHPDGTFIKHTPRERYRDDLHATFPAERATIDRYFADVRRTVDDSTRFMTLQAVPKAVERLGLGWWLGRRFLQADREPLIAYMDRIGASERLREHLWFTWGNYGGVPAETSFAYHALPTEYMSDGLWTLADGSGVAAEGFRATIEAAGGMLRTRAEVTGLIVEGGRAVGVCLGDEQVRARTIISGIGARETYGRLIPADHRPDVSTKIGAMKSSCSIFTLYLSLDREAIHRHGLTGVNYWVEFDRGAMRGIWSDLESPPPWLILSLAPRFQEAEGAGDRVTAEVFVGISGDQFSRFRGGRVMKRGPEYDELKDRLTDLTLRRLEATWPGFGGAIRHVEGASPATIESYTGHLNGAAYGLAPTPGRFSNRDLRVASSLPGLLLTGQDVTTCGVIGAFYAGITAASAVLMRDASRSLRRQAVA